MPSDNEFYIRVAMGAYLDGHDRWQDLKDYGQRFESLAAVRHNIERLRYYKSEIAAAVVGCSDARGRTYSMEELFR